MTYPETACPTNPRRWNWSGRFLGFEFGDFGPLTVRRESVELGLDRPVRLLYASDLHLGHWWTRRVGSQLLNVVRETRPDIVLLGGDLVDNRSALAELHALVEALTAQTFVGAIPGNHDLWLGAETVRAAAIAAGACWLPDGPIEQPFAIDGEVRAARPGAVLCAHDPSIFPEAAAAGYRLVLAGHLHGGQCVLASWRGRLYPAAWFHRWHGRRFRSESSLMLVSQGAGDTFPFRFRCAREVILCDIR